MKTRSLAVAILCSSIISGCASSQKKGIDITSTNDEQLEKLQSAVRDIQQQWNVSNRVSALHTKDAAVHVEIDRLETSLRRVASFPGGYDGTLENFVQQIAGLSGYGYLPPAGKKTIRPIAVIFPDQYQTLGEYLYGAGVQAGKRALLTVNMKEKTLAITYLGY